ncbi:MAG: hypothetical protein RSB37_07710 [Acetivibrio sp.]
MDTQMITPKDIRIILQRYHIGKKPLAKVLGWGETTIIRYLEGDNPSREYSDKLFEIKDNPASFYKLISANSNNITKTAYQKSIKAIFERAVFSKTGILFYYLKNCWEGALSMEGFRCLLYLVQGFHVGMYGKTFFDMEYKISPEKIPYFEAEKNIDKNLTIPQEFLENQLSQKERELLNGIMKAVQWYGFPSLKAFILQENDSLKISRNKENERIVSIETLEKRFQWIIKEYRILKPDDIYKYIDFQYVQIRKWKMLSTW